MVGNIDQNQYKINYNLNFFKQRQNVELDYSFQIESGFEGPHIVLIGALHGNEIMGVEAIVKLVSFMENKGLNLKKGTLSCILGNPLAYEKGIRFFEQNMNRAFLQDPLDTYEGRRVRGIRSFFEKQSKLDFLLDLHSVSSGDFKMCAYLESQEAQEEALQFSPLNMHFVVDPKAVPGSSCEEGQKFGAVSFILECGNHLLPQTVDTALAHIVDLLVNLEMIDLADFKDLVWFDKLSQEVVIYKTLEKIIPEEGFQFADEMVTTGSFVQKGEIYAFSKTREYLAPYNCYIVMPDKNPSIYDTDAGFLCSKKVVSRK